MKYRIKNLNLDGCGTKRCRVYDLPRIYENHYWENVTDIHCPIDGCLGIIRWAENGYVPGYRICDGCGRHFIARSGEVALTRVGNRRYGFHWKHWHQI